MFKDIALPDVRRAIDKEVNALLIVIPLAEKYLSLLRGFFQQSAKSSPVLIEINSAGAITKPNVLTKASTFPKARYGEHTIRKMT